MRKYIILAILLLLGSCTGQDAPEETPRKRGYSYPEVDSAWLDRQGRLYTERRAVSPEGVDIRSAAYLLSGDSLQYVILLRNYDARVQNAPDNQWLVRAEAFEGDAQPADMPDSAMPMRILPVPGHARVLVQSVKLDSLGQVTDQTTFLHTLDAQGDYSEIEGGLSLYPAAVEDGPTVQCWTVSSLQLERGLLHSTRDYSQAGTRLAIAEGEARPGRASLQISPDPVSPARSTVSYLLDLPDSALPVDVEWTFPYHMSYSAESWLPPLFSLPGGELATVLFEPDARGQSERANYNGIFRLATLEPQDGSIRLLHEDIPPKLTILQQEGLLFYCCPTDGDDGTRWEIWACDSTGLRKRRLYVSDDSIYLNLADVMEGRLLFFRQFFAREDSQPVLFSELLEVSTEGLGRGLVRLEKRLGGMADGSSSGIPPISF